MFYQCIDEWLNTALDFGITEFDFWLMTFAEIERVIESKKRVIEAEERRRAIYDYRLADLIGRSVARVYNSNNKLPSLAEAYPELFTENEEEQQAKKDELSILRFKLFAQSYNAKFKEVGNNK